jgi:hypothetical protein
VSRAWHARWTGSVVTVTRLSVPSGPQLANAGADPPSLFQQMRDEVSRPSRRAHQLNGAARVCGAQAAPPHSPLQQYQAVRLATASDSRYRWSRRSVEFCPDGTVAGRSDEAAAEG